MSLIKRLKARHKRRSLRVRSSQISRGLKLRISVYKSLKHIYAQIIDDAKHVTLLSFSSSHLKDVKANKKEIARQVGLELGKKAVNTAATNVFFDRGSYLYHGRVKALADGLREAGLKF